jgi:hypothetical protein
MLIPANFAFRRRAGRARIRSSLHAKFRFFAASAVGMPPPWVYEGSDGVLMFYNGVTRATRLAKLSPGTLIRVEVIGKLPKALAGEPKIGDLLP